MNRKSRANQLKAQKEKTARFLRATFFLVLKQRAKVAHSLVSAESVMGKNMYNF